MEITGVVLAGGRSSRMGSDKSLLPFMDKPLISLVVNELRGAVGEVIIVGNQPGKYGFTGAREVSDIYRNMGPLAGIHAGLVAAKHERVFVCACDMPFITGRLVRFMAEMSRGFDAAVPRMENKHLQPLFAVYSKACLEAIEECLRAGISRITEFYRFVNINYVDEALLREVVDPETVFFNVNTFEDYRKVKELDQGVKEGGACNRGGAVSLEEARDLLIQAVKPSALENVLLGQALGRTLGRDILAGEDLPSFDRSLLDGYAFRSADTERAGPLRPAVLRVIGTVPAGHVAGKEVAPGTAVKIMTGAPVPAGADAVAGKEEVICDGEHIRISRRFKAGSNVVKAGTELAAGDLVAPRGTVVTPVLAGLLAGLGIEEVPCHLRPRVAVLNTGDELVETGTRPGPGKIRNTNAVTLEGFCRCCGADPLMLGNVKDEAEEIALLITRGLELADMVVTTGGVSGGDYDLLRKALAVLGAETLFPRLDIRPGGSTAAAVACSKPVIALSGSPGAAAIAFQLLVTPALKKMAGQTECLPEVVSATLMDDCIRLGCQRRVMEGRLLFRDGEACVSLARRPWVPLLGSNVLVDVPAGSGTLGPGDKVKAYLVAGPGWF